MIRLYLVLIKSKQDELKTLQPLKPFCPFRDACGAPDRREHEPTVALTPKQLIHTFKLEQSQLAFTYCTPGDEPHSFIHEWDTTVFSTVLTGKTTGSYLTERWRTFVSRSKKSIQTVPRQAQ